MAKVSWKSPVSASWTTKADWSSGAVPGAGDDAVLAVPGAYTVSIASTSVAVHSRTRCAARRAKSVRPCGHASAGLRPVAIQGRHASARPRDLLCSTIARPPDARATFHPRILHNAVALDTVSGGRPQRS